MTSPEAVALTSYSARRELLGATAQIDAFAEHAGQFEDGIALLMELDQRWGPTGELAALAAADGKASKVSWYTLLLLTVSEAAGVELDLARQTVRRLKMFTPPSTKTQHSIAGQLIAQELLDAGCIAVHVAIDDTEERVWPTSDILCGGSRTPHNRPA